MGKTEETLSFRISINRLWPGQKLPPGDPRWGRYTRSFFRERHSLDSLIGEIRQGHSFCPVMKGSYRKRENFISAQHIGLDDDRGTPESSIDILAQDPFIAAHAAFLYETLSSTLQHPRSRVVFILESPITDPGQYRLFQQGLAWRFGDTDQSVAEESRFFYGAPNARVIKLGNILSPVSLEAGVVEPFLACLRAQASNPGRDIPRLPRPPVAGDSGAARYVNRAIQEEAAWLATRVEGSGERHRGLLVSAIKLQSLRLSEWLPASARAVIDPYASLMPAARANGYVDKYGEDAAGRAIADGVSYATPRPLPAGWGARNRSRRRHAPIPSFEVAV